MTLDFQALGEECPNRRRIATYPRTSGSADPSGVHQECPGNHKAFAVRFQLERLGRTQEVAGSNPASSTGMASLEPWAGFESRPGEPRAGSLRTLGPHARRAFAGALPRYRHRPRVSTLLRARPGLYRSGKLSLIHI